MTAGNSPRESEDREPSPRETLASLLKSQDAQRQAVVILAFLACTYTLYFAQGFLLPIFLALFLSVILRPFVSALSRVRVPRPLGAAIVLLTVLVALAVTFLQLVDPLSEWINRLPYLVADLKIQFASLKQSIEEAKEITDQVSEITDSGSGEQAVVIEGPGLTEQLFAHAQDAFVSIAATLVLLFFMLAQSRAKLQRVIASLPNRADRHEWREAAERAREDVAVYLRTATLINGLLGCATGIAMAIVGLPSPVLWGVLACLANFLPYIGPLAVLGFISGASFLTFDTWLQISLPPLIYLFMTVAEGQFITPAVLGRRLVIDPIAVFLAVLFWGWIWGIPGALLAVPLLTIFTIVVDRIDSLRVFRVLLK